MARTGGRVISVPGPSSTRVAWQAHGPLHAGPLCGERRRGNQWEQDAYAGRPASGLQVDVVGSEPPFSLTHWTRSYYYRPTQKLVCFFYI
jgi:hypothetical protein